MAQTISDLIGAADRAEAGAGQALFAVLYAELHSMAWRELARSSDRASLGVTTLLHEAYLDMASREGHSFPDRARFMAYACRVMRGLVIDHARRRHALKRGGAFELTTLDTGAQSELADAQTLTNVGDALEVLAQEDQILAQIVDLKFFCGFTFAEIATMHGVSERTVQRQWEKARIFLYRTLSDNALE